MDRVAGFGPVEQLLDSPRAPEAPSRADDGRSGHLRQRRSADYARPRRTMELALPTSRGNCAIGMPAARSDILPSLPGFRRSGLTRRPDNIADRESTLAASEKLQRGHGLTPPVPSDTHAPISRCAVGRMWGPRKIERGGRESGTRVLMAGGRALETPAGLGVTLPNFGQESVPPAQRDATEPNHVIPGKSTGCYSGPHVGSFA